MWPSAPQGEPPAGQGPGATYLPGTTVVPAAPGEESAADEGLAQSEGQRLALSTHDDRVIAVLNFLPEDWQDRLEGGAYYLVGERYGEGLPYSIAFDPMTHLFAIVLLEEPLADTRKLAELDLLGRLGISQSDACYLRYFVTFPGEVNPVYAGKNLGFSFCAGAILL